MVKKIIFIIFLQSLGLKVFAEKSLLRVSVATSNQMPLIDWKEGEKVGGGLLYDLYKAIAAEGGFQLDWKVVPRARLDDLVERKLLDLRCYTAKEWVGNPDLYLWSKSFVTQEEAFIGYFKKDSEVSQNNLELENQTVAVVAGYKYKSLESEAKKRNLTQVEVSKPEAMMELLLSGRVQYGLFTLSAFKWLVRNKNLTESSFTAPVALETQKISCAIPKGSAFPAEKLLKIVNKVIDEKGKDLVRKYE